ncbi:hypothetical protein JKP88DRAFT_307716 [Tribonema minus]|uniref:Uncharacterized protein n=1 Tax=Tribonema minus TaxID=303371 RepID=A0A835Z678_9STRA|nr:hypothetical protein JKP88DRAFT_307716 [Tribonema minus]
MTKAPRKTAEQLREQRRLCRKANQPVMPAQKRTLLTLVSMKTAYVSWGFKLDPDDNKQQKFILKQGKAMSECKMLLVDGTATPRYNDIKQGTIKPANTSPEDAQARKEAGNAKRSATMIARGLRQTNHYEKETFEALLDITGLRGMLDYHWMPDGANGDVALKSKDMAAGTYGACELKASDTTDGGRFSFNVSKTDMETKYKGKLIIAIGFKQVNDKIIVTQVFVLSDPQDMPGKTLTPRVNPKGEDACAHLRIRMDGIQQYKLCKKTILEGVLKVPHHSLDNACFSLEVNRNLSRNHKTEFIGLQFIHNALPATTTMTMASDKNKTVDFLLHRSGESLGISAKTASLHHKKADGSHSGFCFGTSAAPDHHKCDWVLVVYLDKSRKIVEGFSAIRGSTVYSEANKGKAFLWHRSGQRRGVSYKIEKHQAYALPQLVDLMFEQRGGEQITL